MIAGAALAAAGLAACQGGGEADAPAGAPETEAPADAIPHDEAPPPEAIPEDEPTPEEFLPPAVEG